MRKTSRQIANPSKRDSLPIWLRTASQVWLESRSLRNMTGAKSKPLGQYLRATIENISGKRHHEIMRKPFQGDVVLHLGADLKGRKLFGASLVAQECRIKKDRYVIGLKEYTTFDPPLPLNTLLDYATADIRYEIEERDPKHYPFMREGDSGVVLRRNGYLSKVTDDLFQIILAMVDTQNDASGPILITELSLNRRSRQEEFFEGRRMHREMVFFFRNPALVRKIKSERPNVCEVCAFDFSKEYEGASCYVECHHGNPLSERPADQWHDNMRTSVEDIHLLCANCHRLAHRERPAIKVERLKEMWRRARAA